MAVLLATFGVMVVVYGGSMSSKTGEAHPESASSQTTAANSTEAPRATAPLIGDLLTLVASIIYGLYQVLYKKYVALPSSPTSLSDGQYEPIASVDEDPLENAV